jgi:hypothetical protein
MRSWPNWAKAAWARSYRARDTKLNRDVAIKVLPEAFALNFPGQPTIEETTYRSKACIRARIPQPLRRPTAGGRVPGSENGSSVQPHPL